jgi:hypothetical protein
MKSFYPIFLLLLCSFSIHAQDTIAYEMTYSTYLGGNHFEQARDIAVDLEGNFYITGGTSSPDFPVTDDAYNIIYNDEGSSTVGGWGPMMVFVSKFSKTGELIWSTYIGGPNYDRAYAIEVDADGFVYVGGRAGDNFPTTEGAFQENFILQAPINNLYGHQNGFIAKLSPDGSELIWATYYGSDSFGFFRDIDIDDEGNVYGILNAVKTLPNGIPPNAFDTDLNGNYDMIPVKFSSDGSEVIWATVLGGSGEDRGGPSIRVGPDKSVYLAGATKSTDWPVTSNAPQPQSGGLSDLFITRLSPNGDSLIYSTYLGGSDNEFSETHCLEVDHLGQAYIACGSKSNDITTTAGAIKATKTANEGFDALIAKLSEDGSEFMAVSYFGGTGIDFAEGMYVDSLQNYYVAGGTSSENLPVSAGAIQTQLGGQNDGFIIKVSPQFDTLEYCTYWGGEEDDSVRAFHLAASGEIGLSGQTESEDLWVSDNAFQIAHASPNTRADSYFTVLTPEEEPIISSTMEFSEKPLKIFPNPVDDLLFISTDDPIQRIVLYHINGQILKSFPVNQTTLDFSGIKTGTYILQIENHLGQYRFEKVIVL